MTSAIHLGHSLIWYGSEDGTYLVIRRSYASNLQLLLKMSQTVRFAHLVHLARPIPM